MNLIKTLVRYLESTLLLPYYIKCLYDWVRIIAPYELAQRARGQHLSISEGFEACKASRNGDVLTIQGISLLLHPPRVIETVNEVIIKQQYNFEDDDSYVMIDIGMNVAISSLAKAQDLRFKKIYSFEPLKPTYAIARRNLDLNPDLSNKIQTFNFGLSDKNDELTVKYSLDEIMSISSEGTFDSCIQTNVTTEQIQIKKASEIVAPIIRQHPQDRIFLKIDCEGAEFKIIKDLDDCGLLKDIDVAIIEWHNHDPRVILDALRRNGFFCFQERQKVRWNVGLIRAVRLKLGAPVAP